MNQICVKVEDKTTLHNLLCYLTSKGYSNVHKIADNTKLSVPVIVVDKSDKVFFATNVTCMACRVSAYKQKGYPITLEQFLSLEI